MAILDVTEYATISCLPNHTGQVSFELPIAYQQLVIGGGAVQSAPFQQSTRMVRLHCDATCRRQFSYAVAPIAATGGSPRMVQNQTEYCGVPEGGALLISVISSL